MIARDIDLMRPQYSECMGKAGADLSAQKICVDDEYAYHDGELNRLYKQVMATVAAADRPYLRKSQQEWVKFIYDTDKGCPLPHDADLAKQIDVQQCRIKTTVWRVMLFEDPKSVASVIAGQKDTTPPPYIAPKYFDLNPPDADGVITLQPKDYEHRIQATMRIKVGTCEQGRYNACPVQSASIDLHGKTYTLHPLPQEIWYANLGDVLESTLTLTDLNKDGHPDLMLWTGLLGNYNSASYGFYLYDPKSDRFVRNQPLEKAVQGHEIASLQNNRFVLWYRAGPCERGDKVIEVRGSRVVTIRKRDYNTCKGDLPTDGSLLK